MKQKNIVKYFCDALATREEFGLIIGFIRLLQLVIKKKNTTTANPHA
jgi:hypothetical protein